MLRYVVLPGVLVAAIAAGSLMAAPDAGPASGGRKFPLADTPLGRFVTGRLGRLLVLRSELNVTAEQRDQIRAVVVSHRPEIAATVKTLHQKRATLRDAVLAQEADEAKIRAAADELGKAVGDAAVKAAKLKREVAPILTAEQRERIGQFLAEHDASLNAFLDKAAH